MLRSVRLTILLLALASGASPWLNATNRADAALAWTFSQTPMAGKSTFKDEGADADLARRFNQTVRPFVTAYCLGCHSGKAPAASLDLQPYATMKSVIDDFPHWTLMLRKLTAKEMPPQGMKQPPENLRRQVIEWITAMRKNEARKNAGDPGAVLARRLSNAEYNYTIRDLTGVDLRPAREFPVDPANQAGFDNSAESLTISPELMAKYLDAARRVADHLVLKPDGVSFAPHPMLVETDREKYPIQLIVDFYDRQPTDFAQYFEAAWRYKHRVALGRPAATLPRLAAQTQVSPRYLAMVWQALERTKEEVGPLVKLQAMWRELPAPKGNQPDLAHEGCVRMRDFVVKIRRRTEKLFTDVEAPGFSPNFQPIVVYRLQLLAGRRRDFDPSALRVEGKAPPQGFVVTRGPTFGNREAEELKRAVAAYIKERQEDPDLVVPAGERARYEAAFARFSSVFPTAFCLRERGRFYPITSMDKGRLLGAGFHNIMGYFRDDTPLIELILDEKGKKELDRLWEEFDFIADYTVRTYFQFIFNAGEGGGVRRNVDRPSQNEFATEVAIFRLRDQLLAKSAPGTDPMILEAVKDYFDRTNTQIRWVERARMEAEPTHLDALVKFAARAYRRPLAQDERDDILAYYRDLREKKGQGLLTHEEAMRASIASILTSPDFLYRVDLVNPNLGAPARSAHQPAANGRRPLSGYSLASRLSYFLWSSMPDEELLSHAASGDLSKPAVLAAQVRRMLKDSRARALGEVILPPPPAVPELPHDESKSDLPVRELLAKHRENKMCASCHARFDSFGLAFEGYGPVGEGRARDLAGRPVDVRATFPGGIQGAGLDGLLSYIRANREKDFLNNLSEKALAYALGRSLLISDEPLLDEMQVKLAANGYKMSALIETIVTSPQFLNRRSPEFSQQSNTKIAQQKGGN